MGLSRSARLLVAAGLALAACGGGEAQQAAPETAPVIGLSSSLPIVWAESTDIAAMLRDETPPHWALAALRERGELRPLDSLAGENGKLPLPANGVLVMAQPWPLSPQENVALDDWVRLGGKVLLFADPMLTFESQFAIGDRRRPQDVALLSPILSRWGLALRFAEDQPAGERTVDASGIAIPVNLHGFLVTGEQPGRCNLSGHGLLADCRIGKGRMIAIADAGLFESLEDDGAGRRAAVLRTLLDRLER